MRINFPQVILASYGLLSPKERKKAFSVSLLSFVGGAADMVSVITVYPLISVLVQPDLINKNLQIRKVWELFGEASPTLFILELALVAILTIITGSGLNFLAQVQSNRFVASCQERLGFDLMGAMIKAPYIWHLEHNPILLANLFENHIIIWGREIIRGVCSLFGQIATIFLPIFAIISWSPVLGVLILFTALAFQLVVFKMVRGRTKNLAMQRGQSEQWLLVFLAESLQGIKDVKLSSQQQNFMKSFVDRYHIYCQAISATNNWNLIPMQMTNIAGQLAILVIGVGLFLSGIQGGELASTMAIVVLAAARVFPTISRAGSFVSHLNEYSVWIESLIKIHDTLKKFPQENKFSKKVLEPLAWKEVVLRDVSFVYPNSQKNALYPINLSLKRGGSYAIVGASGAGKSTLMDVIIGLIEPSTGSVEVDGVKINSKMLPSWQSNIGYVPQSPMILDASLLENIAFGIKKDEINVERVCSAIIQANLGDVLEGLPGGLEAKLGNRGIMLSGGQRQRVAIARAMYHNPDILVFDEASSALDAISERAIRESLLHLSGSVTVITIAHRLSSIQSCDCIFLLSEGRLAAQGNYSFFEKNNKLFRDLFLNPDENRSIGIN